MKRIAGTNVSNEPLRGLPTANDVVDALFGVGLPIADDLTGIETFYIIQGGVMKKVSIDQLPAGLGSSDSGAGEITVVITKEQLTKLASHPVQVLPAPGAGKIISIKYGRAEYITGTSPFFNIVSPTLYLRYANGLSSEGIASIEGIQFMTPANAIKIFPGYLDNNGTDIRNQAIYLIEDGSDFDVFGTATSVTIADGGSDYAPGDAFTVQILSGGLTGVVETVGEGGLATSVSLSGTAWTYSGTDVTTNTGIGVGLRLNIEVATPETGYLVLTLEYETFDSVWP